MIGHAITYSKGSHAIIVTTALTLGTSHTTRKCILIFPIVMQIFASGGASHRSNPSARTSRLGTGIICHNFGPQCATRGLLRSIHSAGKAICCAQGHEVVRVRREGVYQPGRPCVFATFALHLKPPYPLFFGCLLLPNFYVGRGKRWPTRGKKPMWTIGSSIWRANATG